MLKVNLIFLDRHGERHYVSSKEFTNDPLNLIHIIIRLEYMLDYDHDQIMLHEVFIDNNKIEYESLAEIYHAAKDQRLEKAQDIIRKNVRSKNFTSY